MQIASRLRIELDPENWEQIWALLDKHGEPDYLYAIVDSASSLVKFGKSKNPGARLKTLKIGNGSNLKIFAYCENKSPLTEKEIHRRLSDERISGEWFRLCDKSQAVINEMRKSAGV